MPPAPPRTATFDAWKSLSAAVARAWVVPLHPAKETVARTCLAVAENALLEQAPKSCCEIWREASMMAFFQCKTGRCREQSVEQLGRGSADGWMELFENSVVSETPSLPNPGVAKPLSSTVYRLKNASRPLRSRVPWNVLTSTTSNSVSTTDGNCYGYPYNGSLYTFKISSRAVTSTRSLCYLICSIQVFADIGGRERT